MSTITYLFDLFMNIDHYLIAVINQYGFLTYLLLFLVIFIETGLVIMPFLPGDSLIFAASALSAEGTLNVFLLFFIFSAAAILGDTLNYWIGSYIGKRAFQRENSKIFKKEYLEKTEGFYEKHGGKTIILARFIPIIRTFAPFIAGVGHMNYKKFLSYNIFGGIGWVALFVLSGYWFGQIPLVKNNFSFVIIAIILISISPIVIEFFLRKIRKHKKA